MHAYNLRNLQFNQSTFPRPDFEFAIIQVFISYVHVHAAPLSADAVYDFDQKHYLHATAQVSIANLLAVHRPNSKRVRSVKT